MTKQWHRVGVFFVFNRYLGKLNEELNSGRKLCLQIDNLLSVLKLFISALGCNGHEIIRFSKSLFHFVLLITAPLQSFARAFCSFI